MSYMLYEVWTEDEIGHQEVVETTASQKEAFEIAEQCMGEGHYAVIVYQETETGDQRLIKRFESA